MTAQQPQNIALLGVTGNTGQVILRKLLGKREHNLKIYARSQEKLLHMFPGLADDKRVQFYIGSTNDQRLMCDLLSDADTIISTVGSDGMSPTSSNGDTAKAVVKALESRKSSTNDQKVPRLLWLSSSTTNKRFAAARPAFVDWLVKTAFQVGYKDLYVAHNVLQARPDLCSVCFIQPGILVDEDATGYEISTESVRLASSFQDLGEAFVELATNSSHNRLSEVGVSSKGGDRAARYAPYMLTRMYRGLFTCYIPFGPEIDTFIGRMCPWYKM